MSLIHDALRKKEQIQEGAALIAGATGNLGGGGAGAAGIGGSESRMAQFYPAFIGGGGVLVAALITYLISRPGDITVVVAPQPATAASVGLTSGVSNAPATGDLGAAVMPAASQEGFVFQPWQPNAPLAPGAPQSAVSPQQMLPAVPPGAGLPYAPTQPAPPAYGEMEPTFRQIPVYHGATLTNPQSMPSAGGVPSAGAAPAAGAVPTAGVASASATYPAAAPAFALPPDAVTIEMSEAKLASQTGGVTINGASSSPGARLRVGSEIRTDQTGGATLNFARASVDLAQASAARISRLERRVTPTGAPEEEVTIHLNEGSVHAVVQPGDGSVLVSTPALTAATQSGAFTVSTHDDGSVSVRNEGGMVRLVPSERQNESYILRTNESVVYRNKQWVKQ